ncbi:MAG: hypothetical protein KJ799_02780 [Bacteroidetes bacterium]|nr:hypothetical protein [Bacteroidota bacterium]MBU1678006.1 hypothetical protein [Bacteroidota bacterium]MBU2505634.1 hypothetical protein [Bacteroidota bacterium]
MERKKNNYLSPVLLAMLIFASNFLSTDIFKVAIENFTVWFVLSLFSFVCGWLINKTLGWVYGGKVVFSVIIATVVISIMLVLYFNDHFGVNDLLSENLFLYSLRNIMLGSMAFFGMALAELIQTQNKLELAAKNSDDYEKLLNDAKREAEFIVEKGKLKADNLIFEAEKKSADLELRRRNIESRLKEFLEIEKEIIRKYESEENS